MRFERQAGGRPPRGPMTIPGPGFAARLFAILSLLLVSAQAGALDHLVFVTDGDAPAYREFLAAARTTLAAGHNPPKIDHIDATGHDAHWLTRAVPASAEIIVGVGSQGTLKALGAKHGKPVLAALIPRLTFESILAETGTTTASGRVSAVFLDQPYGRQMRLIRLALPDKRRIGVLLGPSTADEAELLRRAGDGQRLNVQTLLVREPDALAKALDAALRTNELILAVPDPDVFNRQTVQYLFLTTYRREVPIVGFSEAYVNAGAAIGLYSAPAQIGRQVAETIGQLTPQSSIQLPPPQYPFYFSIAVNARVAHSLGIRLGNAAELTEKLRRQEPTP